MIKLVARLHVYPESNVSFQKLTAAIFIALGVYNSLPVKNFKEPTRPKAEKLGTQHVKC